MPIAETLKKKRKAARLTQIQLAEISGVSQQAISFIENGRNTPSEGTLRLLAGALKCTVAELLDETEPAGSEMTQAELRLMQIIRQLNTTGIEKVIEYASDILDNDRYKKGEPSRKAE